MVVKISITKNHCDFLFAMVFVIHNKNELENPAISNSTEGDY